MKTKAFFFCVFYLLSGQTVAQKGVLINISQSFAYYRLDNVIKFSIDNYPCASIIIKTNNGTVRNYGDCQLQIIPTERSDIKLSFFQSKKGDTVLIGTKMLTLKNFTDFVVNLVTQSAVEGGHISKSALLVTNGLYAYANGYCSEATKTNITTVHIVGIRNMEPLFDLKCSSGVFSDDIMEAFKIMKTGDKLFISAQVKSLGTDALQLKTINLTIK